MERGSLEAALNARRNEKIGVVVKPWNSYTTGDFVFVEECESGNLVVSMPMLPDEIERQKAKGSALRDWSCVVGVPSDRVKIVLKNKE